MCSKNQAKIADFSRSPRPRLSPEAETFPRFPCSCFHAARLKRICTTPPIAIGAEKQQN
ncbi:MAG: hypothetical protein LBO64_09035 [Desulfovibrio sp.]|nr:hypothetical protein [Desulfovibrio sp.]